MRPLFYEFPEEPSVAEVQHSFMLGALRCAARCAALCAGCSGCSVTWNTSSGRARRAALLCTRPALRPAFRTSVLPCLALPAAPPPPLQVPLCWWLPCWMRGRPRCAWYCPAAASGTTTWTVPPSTPRWPRTATSRELPGCLPAVLRCAVLPCAVLCCQSRQGCQGQPAAVAPCWEFGVSCSLPHLPTPPTHPTPLPPQRPRAPGRHPLLPAGRVHAGAQGAAAPVHRAGKPAGLGIGGPRPWGALAPACPCASTVSPLLPCSHVPSHHAIAPSPSRHHHRTADGARPPHPGGGPGQAGQRRWRAVRRRRPLLRLPGTGSGGCGGL